MNPALEPQTDKSVSISPDPSDGWDRDVRTDSAGETGSQVPDGQPRRCAGLAVRLVDVRTSVRSVSLIFVAMLMRTRVFSSGLLVRPAGRLSLVREAKPEVEMTVWWAMGSGIRSCSASTQYSVPDAGTPSGDND